MILMDLGTLKPLNSSSVVTGGVPSQSISGAKKRSDPKMVPSAEGAPQKSPSETLVQATVSPVFSLRGSSFP